MNTGGYRSKGLSGAGRTCFKQENRELAVHDPSARVYSAAVPSPSGITSNEHNSREELTQLIFMWTLIFFSFIPFEDLALNYSLAELFLNLLLWKNFKHT